MVHFMHLKYIWLLFPSWKTLQIRKQSVRFLHSNPLTRTFEDWNLLLILKWGKFVQFLDRPRWNYLSDCSNYYLLFKFFVHLLQFFFFFQKSFQEHFHSNALCNEFQSLFKCIIIEFFHLVWFAKIAFLITLLQTCITHYSALLLSFIAIW